MKIKKLFLCSLITLVSFVVAIGYSQQDYTIAWNEVVMSGDITYEIYLKKNNIETLIGETDLLEYTINLEDEGLYIVGVRTKRVFENNTTYSDMNWSNEDGVFTPNPFVLEYYLVVPAPINLRLM